MIRLNTDLICYAILKENEVDIVSLYGSHTMSNKARVKKVLVRSSFVELTVYPIGSRGAILKTPQEYLVNPSQILMLESADEGTMVYPTNGKGFHIRKSLIEVHRMLKYSGFSRIEDVV